MPKTIPAWVIALTICCSLLVWTYVIIQLHMWVMLPFSLFAAATWFKVAYEEWEKKV